MSGPADTLIIFCTERNVAPRMLPDSFLFYLPLKNKNNQMKTIDTKHTCDALSEIQEINQSNDWIIISSAFN